MLPARFIGEQKSLGVSLAASARLSSHRLPSLEPRFELRDVAGWVFLGLVALGFRASLFDLI